MGCAMTEAPPKWFNYLVLIISCSYAIHLVASGNWNWIAVVPIAISAIAIKVAQATSTPTRCDSFNTRTEDVAVEEDPPGPC